MVHSKPTNERIMLAAIDLMSDKGYDQTTTKEIADAAGVNEVTLFRHFGSKQNLLEQAIRTYHYGEEMTKLFEHELQEELQHDLLLISTSYHRIMNRNRKLLNIMHRGSKSLPESIYIEAHKHPQQLKELLTAYFIKMEKQQKLIASLYPELQAQAFMWMNHGAYQRHLDETTLQQFIKESVTLFVRGLTP